MYMLPELKENIVKVGADIKDKVMRSIKSTWATINDFARAHTGAPGQPAITDEQLSQEVDRTLQSAVASEERLDTSELECE